MWAAGTLIPITVIGCVTIMSILLLSTSALISGFVTLYWLPASSLMSPPYVLSPNNPSPTQSSDFNPPHQMPPVAPGASSPWSASPCPPLPTLPSARLSCRSTDQPIPVPVPAPCTWPILPWPARILGPWVNVQRLEGDPLLTLTGGYVY